MYKFPKSLAVCADNLYTMRQARLKAQKVVEEMEAHEQALKAHIIDNLPKSLASGVAGKIARVTIVTKEVAQVKDWDVFYKYVKKTGQFDLMQRRLADAAVKERWENNVEVPGVEKFQTKSISLNKV